VSCTGTSATCPADTDKQAPKLNPGTNQTHVGTCSSAPVGFTLPTLASASCETGMTVTCTALSGKSYGVHTVTCKAKDASGNVSAAVTFTVTVLQLLTVRIQPPLSGDNDTIDNFVNGRFRPRCATLCLRCERDDHGVGGREGRRDLRAERWCQCQQSRHDDLDRRCRHERRHDFRRHVLPLQPGYEGLLRDRVPPFYQENITVAYKSAPSVALGSDVIELDTK